MTSCTRTIYSRQPARIFLVDLSPPMERDTLENLCTALDHYFALVCSLHGRCRVPFFGLIALDGYPEVLFPLQNVRGNYPHLQSVINDLQVLGDEGFESRHKMAPAPGLTQQGINEAMTMYRRQAQSLLQTAGYWSQLEISLVTSRTASSVVKEAEKAMKDIPLDSIKKVQVVSVTSSDSIVMSLCDEASSSQTSSHSTTSAVSSGGESSPGMVDFVNIENDELSIENYLKCWLHDVGTDTEHLHLVLPGADDSNMALKCDLQERLLSPQSTPFNSSFTLGLDGSTGKSMQQSSAKGSDHTIPIYQLNVTAKVPQDAVCESVLFGTPLVVRPTACWKMDWDELDHNQQYFHALCHSLSDKGEVLVAKMEDDSNPKVSASTTHNRGFQYKPPVPKPSGHFMLLPSQKCCLLVKPIAVSELVLPVEFTTVELPADGALDAVQKALSLVDSMASYNPLLIKSGLYDSLTYNVAKPAVPPAQSKCRSFGLSRNQKGGSSLHKSQNQSRKPQAYEKGLSSHDQDDLPDLTVTKAKRTKLVSGKAYYTQPKDPFPTQL